MKQNLVLYSATTGSERREIRCFNQVEQALQEVYGPEGLVVAELENMTFAEQVRLFKGARAVIGIHGAGLANMVFCRPGTTLIEVDPEWPFNWVFVNHFCQVYGVKRVCCSNDPSAVILCASDNIDA
jgi:capsular polysaccharide biosynthesis protein